MSRLRLFARVPAYGQPSWHGPDRHPESTHRFNSVVTLQHVARTLAVAPFDGVLVDPPGNQNEPGAVDPWLCAMVLALAAPTLAVGFRCQASRKAGSPDPGPLLGGQWLGDQPLMGPLISARVIVAANRWMAEDQLEYVLRRYPQITPPGKPKPSMSPAWATLSRARGRNRPSEDIPIVVGTPQEVADDLERMLVERESSTAAHEGPWNLELVPIHIPGSYETFVRMVVPQLRHRGLIGEHADSWRPTI